jgi:hypothetical protein
MNLKYLSHDEVVKSLVGYQPGIKTAFDLSSIEDWVGSYFKEKFSKPDQLANIINIALPALTLMLGFPKFSILMELANVLGVDIGKIASDFFSKIGHAASTGQQVSPEQVEAMAQQTVNAEYPKVSENSSKLTSSDIRMLKVSHLMIKSGQKKVPAAIVAKHKLSITSILIWFGKLLLTALGLTVANDAAKKMLGKPNDIDAASGTQPSSSTSGGQTGGVQGLEINPNYPINEQLNMSNVWSISTTLNNLPNMLINWTTYIYPELKGMESQIKSSAAFQAVVDEIEFNNRLTPTAKFINIPQNYHSRKQIVDAFVSSLPPKKK